MRKSLFIVFVFGMFKYTHTQFLTIGANRKLSKTTSCDPTLKSTLVEHFFNIIFTEFHNTPPVCVCVQMCLDQPTYCYPNGCLKRAEKNKKLEVPLPVTRISENTKPIFFVDEKNDFMNDFLAKNYIDDNNIIAAPLSTQTEVPLVPNMRPDPFKDRYKILFKYKKMPKVELKYNLGEQVKNTKSEALKNENVDVSQTRWPVNKIDRRLSGGRRSLETEPQVQTSTPNPKYFINMYSDKDENYQPKYSKRELSNDTNSDVKGMYVGKTESESNAFSLEKLIDSLIESSFDKNVTSSDSDAQTKSLVNETTQFEEIINAANETSTTPKMMNESLNIISKNFTNKNRDKNKYLDYITMNGSKNISDMIATLSKRIDIQNNTSLEIMKRLTGDFEFESFSVTSEKPIETTSLTTRETTTEEYTSLPIIYETRTTRKIRQRILRRFHNGKHNK